MFNFKELKSEDIQGKKIIIRVDFNSSFEKGKIKNDFRIKKTLPAINWLTQNKSRVIIITHLEESDGNIPDLNVFFDLFRKNFFEQKFSNNLKFVNDITGEKAQKAAEGLAEGHILLLNNLRLDKREIENDIGFSGELASLGEIYINEAFSVSHKAHSSIVGIPKYLPSFAGFNFKAEVQNLSRIFFPSHPFFVFIGGKKVLTKEKAISKFLEKADFIVLGGLMAAEFLYASGKNIGKTDIDFDALDLIKNKFLNNPKIIVPDKFIVSSFGRTDDAKTINISDINNEDIIQDVAPAFFESLEDEIISGKMILWNGPMGLCEKGFDAGTKKLISIFFQSKAEVIAGGGETVDFLNSLELAQKFSFVSTGGGAMLEFLANGTLPGIEALLNNTI